MTTPSSEQAKGEYHPSKMGYGCLLISVLLTIYNFWLLKNTLLKNESLSRDLAVAKESLATTCPTTTLEFSHEGDIVTRHVPQGSTVHIITYGPINDQHLLDVRFIDTSIATKPDGVIMRATTLEEITQQ